MDEFYLTKEQAQQLTPEEKWEKATLANNFIFYKVMRHHLDACKHLIEILLNIEIEKMEMRNEEVIEIDFDSKGIRLDVFVKDKDKMYDIELQTTNTKELPERSRYYQALMDLDTLKAGQTYKELKDSHVIFICFDDIFNQGLPVYTFENICKENGKTQLNDRTIKHFFIAETCAKMIKDEDVRRYFQFLISNNPSDDYTSALNQYVFDAKHNMQWRFQFMTWERQRAYDLETGIAIGEKKMTIENAKNLYKNGVSKEIIAKSLNMTIEEVEAIVNDTE